MRTNALLLAAAVVAGGSLLAQTTSKNIVGYVNKTVPKDQFVLIANPLNNGGNTVAEVIKISGDITLYHFGATGFTSSLTLGGEWIEGGDVVVAPGGGFFATASGADVKITFVGEVAVGASVTIPAGLSIRSSALPQAGKLDALEYPVGDETVYQYSNGYIATDALGAWLGDAPTVGVAESFFVLNNGTSKSWTRSFTIN
jgi:hypothetical protein